jgi:hypothetical protein
MRRSTLLAALGTLLLAFGPPLPARAQTITLHGAVQFNDEDRRGEVMLSSRNCAKRNIRDPGPGALRFSSLALGTGSRASALGRHDSVGAP